MATEHPTFTEEELQNEIWKTIPEYEGLYLISTLGKVKRLKPRNRKSFKPNYLLTPYNGSHGYLIVALIKDKKVRTFTIHRLMAITFFGPRPEGYHVNHKDANKWNNKLSNLEYVTHAENIAHAKKLGLFPRGEDHWMFKKPHRIPKGEQIARAIFTSEQIRDIKARIARGEKRKEIANRYGVAPTYISQIKHGKVWRHIEWPES